MQTRSGANKAKADKLQGSWIPVSQELFGKRVSTESIDILKVTFHGDKIVFNKKNNPTETFTYKVNGQNLNLIWSDGPLTGKMTTMVYQIDGTMLRLSNGEAKQAPSALTLKRAVAKS
jgi:uncharacterized protein (TIGR03067 family)